MALGDLKIWANHFVSVDERLLERVEMVWPKCLVIFSGQPEEDAITINLVQFLTKDPIVRRICHWVEYQFEPFGTLPSGAKYSKGKIDLAVLLDWERERYLAYECKRLNVIYSGKRNSLAAQYVTEGMMRFMTEQYAEGLPVGFMLGYVIDGDTQFAIDKVTSSIASDGKVGLVGSPVNTLSIGNIRRFSTNHLRNSGGTIQLRHALLSFPSTVGST